MQMNLNPATSRSGSVLLVLLCWAITYLSFLGSSELRSEEGHRVLPAVRMLETGNYLVPFVGAEPYLKKPPLMNWIVAGSFKFTGVRNDWTARLPSPSFVLAVALLLVISARDILGANGALIAGLCWLTTLGMIEKGRMIELEALYVSLFGAALFTWLVLWQQDRSPWLTFTVPWTFLGLSLLAKGPADVFFFYSVVVAVLWSCGRLRDLRSPAHLLGLLIMLLIFGAWAIPYFRALHWHSVLEVWRGEAGAALHGEEGRSENWWLNFPRGLAYFLPWLLLVPFIRPGMITDRKTWQVVRGLVLGAVVPFVFVLLVPGTLPRYILPLLAPFCWIVGASIRSDAFRWTIPAGTRTLSVSKHLVWGCIAVGVAAAMIMYPLRSITFLRRHERIKPVAAEINGLVPENERVFVVNSSYQPYLFYLHRPLNYVRSVSELPKEARYVIAGSAEEPELKDEVEARGLRAQVVTRTPKYRKRETVLVRLVK